MGDHGVDQRLLVGEVVVELRARDPGRLLDVLDAGPGDAALEDQLRRRADDPLARLRALAGEARRSSAARALVVFVAIHRG